MTEEKGIQSGQVYGLEQAIESSEIRGVYYLRQAQIMTSAAMNHKNHPKDMLYGTFLGLYKTYNELSVFETMRLLKIAALGNTPT